MKNRQHDLSPEAFKAVQKIVEERGLPFGEALSFLVINGSKIETREESSTDQDQEQAWLEFITSGKEHAKHSPNSLVVDDSRESIYSGQGE